jgi:hypothetical protein
MTFAMLYSEPLSVALAAGALLALVNRRWLLAGIIGAAGTAERPTLIVLVAAAGIAAIQAIWTRREWRALLAPILTPLGVLAYFGYFGHLYHDYSFWFWIEKKGWNAHIDWGVHMLRIVLWADPKTEHYKVFNWLLIIMFFAAVAGIAMMIAARLPIPVTLFGILAALLTVVSAGQVTKPRFVWAAFPLSSARPRSCRGLSTGRCSSFRPQASSSSSLGGRTMSSGPRPEPCGESRI